MILSFRAIKVFKKVLRPLMVSVLVVFLLLLSFKKIRTFFPTPEIKDGLIGFSQYYGYPFYFDTIFFFLLIFLPVLILFILHIYSKGK